MRRPASIFAEVAHALEDLHAVAHEGCAEDLTPDLIAPLAAHVRQGLSRIERHLRELPQDGTPG